MKNIKQVGRLEIKRPSPGKKDRGKTSVSRSRRVFFNPFCQMAGGRGRVRAGVAAICLSTFCTTFFIESKGGARYTHTYMHSKKGYNENTTMSSEKFNIP